MWIKSDEDVKVFMNHIRSLIKRLPNLTQSQTLAVVEHELGHTLYEDAPGKRSVLK